MSISHSLIGIFSTSLKLFIQATLQIIIIIGCIAASVNLSDYLLPGKEVRENVTGKYVESNQRYPGRYSASAFKIFTPNRAFYVERSFFIQVQKDDPVVLSLSRFFGTVNSYQCRKFMDAKETFSLRLVAGLLLPLSMLLLSAFYIKFKLAPIRFLIFLSFIINSITIFTLL